jgi:FkbM family methyltransferase
LTRFLERTGGRFHLAHLFEPDPANFQALKAQVAALGPERANRVACHQLANGRGPGKLQFRAGSGEGSALAEDGDLEVTVASLDDCLGRTAPTFIKMDIEGAEWDALAGAAGLIRKHQPALAICLYHRPEDPWRIPVLMRDWLPGCRIAIRPHAFDGWEWVAYAIPQHPRP